ncbi:phosphodiester glycosidase family protein [Virgibacillus sp. DJP39]|uniref:phosphodiester glycosidase family protein n=1 Tax=Virgibacillus sp. DJP39 TaxID=3409790 RepID=UPI003BB6D137
MNKIIHLFIFMFLIVFTAIPMTAGAATINEQFNVSDGVSYKDIRYSEDSIMQAVRVMEIDISNPDTYVDIGVPTALNRLQTTTAFANFYSQENRAVVGAINGSFFHLGTSMNLVSKDNRLVHAGEVYDGEEDKFVNKPIAFGIGENGKGIIDNYQLEMKYIHNNKSYSITSTNKARSPNNTILYTSYFPGETTKTNQWGTEVVVTLPSPPSLKFGTTVTGKVESIRQSGDETETVIPKNGFVISAHGTGSEQMSDIKVGDSISLSIDIDSKWQDSSFMLASGPMLVKDGSVSVTMNQDSANAKYRAPRTAVAIDRTGEKVFFVTVDGRQSGYSNGMTIKQFADYLVNLGAYRALNLDGGGSTTMVTRFPGTDRLSVANSPSDGYERSVSTILMALSTAPLEIFRDVASSHWAYPSTTKLFRTGTINGYPGGYFEPNGLISRTETAIMLTRELNLDTSQVTDPGFKDVKPTDKYYKEIAAAANAGLFKGREEDMFVKAGELTRGEMAVLIQRAYHIENTSNSYFPDVKTSHFAYEAINALAYQGIAEGMPDGTFRPENSITRAEFSELLFKVNY